MIRFSLLTLALAAMLGLAFIVSAPVAHAQVAVEVGAAPDCPYGYYDAPPYNCAPYGYYGPEWFTDGIFIGAGPWFHGPANFHGYVDNHFHPDHGYHGPTPNRGEHADRHIDAAHFKGNEMRDGHGHVVKK
jgi:hypothetical protein